MTGRILGPVCPDVEQRDHAAAAAEHLLALVAQRDPAFPVTGATHQHMVDVVESVARLVLLGRGS